MRNVTIRLRQDLIDSLDDEADDRDVSRSEYIRQILDDRHEVDELRDRLDAREARIDELEEQLARRSQIGEKVDTLAKRVDEQDTDATPPFPIRWYRWFRSRGDTAEPAD